MADVQFTDSYLQLVRKNPQRDVFDTNTLARLNLTTGHNVGSDV